MLKKFYPYEYVENVFDIDYELLYKKGFRSIIFDIDNTLVYHGMPSNDKIDELFKKIHNIGFKTLLLSNNGVKRIEEFNKNICTKYISNANKPFKKNYLKALEILDTKKENTVFIGDQIFTDIFGANKCKIPNILVKFIRLDSETYFGKRRQLEDIILKAYLKSKYINRLKI